jgi:hypothetical protein
MPSFLLIATIALLFTTIALLFKIEHTTVPSKPTTALIIKRAMHTANAAYSLVTNINIKATNNITIMANILVTIEKFNTTLDTMQQQQHQTISTTPTAYQSIQYHEFTNV